MEQQKEALVFGDPDAVLTVGVFVRWLEERFIPHDEQDAEQSRSIREINVALLGNGTPEHGMKHQHQEMWDILQRVSHFLSTGKLLWAGVLSILVAVAAVASLLKSLGVL